MDDTNEHDSVGSTPSPGYEPPKLAVHGTMAEVTAAHSMGPSMDHHFPMNGRPGTSH